MVIVANNSTLQEFAAESKPVRPITRDFTVAYISLSESGYCRHKKYFVMNLNPLNAPSCFAILCFLWKWKLLRYDYRSRAV